MTKSTSTAVAVKAPTYNPVTFQRDFTALAVQNPKKAAVMAGDWRGRLENALVSAESAAEAAIAIGTAAGTNLAFSIITNYRAEKKAHIEEQWKLPNPDGDATQKKAAEVQATMSAEDFAKSSPFKDGKIKDPTTMWLPVSVWLVLGTGLIALATRNNPTGGMIARNTALGAVTNMTGDLGRMFARSWFKDNLKKAEAKANG